MSQLAIEVKTCSICKEGKPISEFVKDKRSSSGAGSRCKPCKAKASKYYNINSKRKPWRLELEWLFSDPVYKVCNTCNINKPLTDFNKECKLYGGRRRTCRQCNIDYKKKYRNSNKIKAFQIVGRGKIECICGCGCTDIRFLEINHKNGGGNKEHKKTGNRIYLNIILGRRSIDDLELTCMPYNRGTHAAILKYGLSSPPFKIVWLG